MIRRILGASLLALVMATGMLVSMTRSEGFPHEDHAGLFPTCLGCHSGIPEGDEEAYFSVAPRDCIRCHDGIREETVTWDAPARTTSNLMYEHVEHIAEVEAAGDSAIACAECHGPFEEDLSRMDVDRVPPATCTGCHAHEAADHLASEVVCAECHAILTDATELSPSRIADFPEPPSHTSESFLLEHGEAGATPESCAVCHARETCVRCHLNADVVQEITALGTDERVALLEIGLEGEWPEPPDHTEADWEFTHGSEIDDVTGTCANCHAETSCRSCHGSAAIPEIAALPNPSGDQPIGVVVPRTRPPGHLPMFASQHGTAAAADLPKCSSCHLESQCEDCHTAPSRIAQQPSQTELDPRLILHADPAYASIPPEPRSGYHPANFLMRHGSEAFAVQTVCSDCHSTEVFCRDCHQTVGVAMGAGAGSGGAYHDAEPNWFFEHGRAARQGLESCASCHQQTSCLRCHSAKSGLRVSPHGPGFDATREANRSTASCGICHTSTQIVTE